MPTVYAELDSSATRGSGKYICSICVYDPDEHDGVTFEDWRDP